VLGGYLKWRHLQGITIRIFTDSQVAAAYLRKMGGRFQHLREIATRVMEECEKRNISLLVEVVEGKNNFLADHLSRLPLEASEWKLHRGVFRKLDHLWGPHTVDFFASPLNAQLRRYATWHMEQ